MCEIFTIPARIREKPVQVKLRYSFMFEKAMAPDLKPADLYTLEGMQWLRDELARKEAQWDNYSGNNPNKGAAERRALRTQLDAVIESLKVNGVTPYTPEEALKKRLDKQTPGRLKSCCTQLDGQWYELRLTGKNEHNHWTWKWDPISFEEVEQHGYIHPGPGRRSN